MAQSPPAEGYVGGNVNPIGIRSCYDEGKRVAETLMMDYHRQNGVIPVARIFNTSSPDGRNDGRVISNLSSKPSPGKYHYYGEGQQMPVVLATSPTWWKGWCG